MPRFSRPNGGACALGLNCNFETAVNTLLVVLADTVHEPFMTRDTVAVETAASLPTSFTVHGFRVMPSNEPLDVSSQPQRTASISSSGCLSSQGCITILLQSRMVFMYLERTRYRL